MSGYFEERAEDETEKGTTRDAFLPAESRDPDLASSRTGQLLLCD